SLDRGRAERRVAGPSTLANRSRSGRARRRWEQPETKFAATSSRGRKEKTVRACAKCLLSLRPEAVLLHLVDQCDARDAEPACGFGLVAAGGVERARDEPALERLDLLLERRAVARVGRRLVA